MNKIVDASGVEIMRLSYALVEDDFSSDDIREAKTALQAYKDNMDEVMATSKREIKKEKLCQLRNVVLRLIGDSSLDMTDKEIEVLNKKLLLAGRFRQFFVKLDGVITEDNCRDVLKLAKFTEQNFLSNYNYLDEVHRVYDLEANGISYYPIKSTDEQDFTDFFYEEFKNVKTRSKTGKELRQKVKSGN